MALGLARWGVGARRDPVDAATRVPPAPPRPTPIAPPPPLRLALFKARTESLDEPVRASGKVMPYEELELFSQGAGTLTAFLVKNGDRVRAGQTVARMDWARLAVLPMTAPLVRGDAKEQAAKSAARQREAEQAARDSGARAEALEGERQSAQTEAESAHASRLTAEAAEKSAAEKADAAAKQSQRMARLYAQGLVARRDSEKAAADQKAAGDALTAAGSAAQAAREAASTAQERLKKAEAALQQARDDSARASAALEAARATASSPPATPPAPTVPAAPVTVQHTEMQAPVAGTVVRRLARAGTLVRPGTPILAIRQTGRTRVQVRAPLETINRIGVGAAVKVTATGRAPALRGRVLQRVADPGPAARTGVVEVLINSETGLKPGASVSMEVAATPLRMTVVPRSAILHDPAGAAYVWTAEPVGGSLGRLGLRRRLVTVAAFDPWRAGVAGGITVGAFVVRFPSPRLMEGATVVEPARVTGSETPAVGRP